MGAQTVSTCVVCGAVTEAFLCGDARRETGCLGKLIRRLGDCAALVDELNTTISRQDKLGSASVGYVSNGGGERPLPVNLGVMDAGALLRDRLSSWARMLWEDNAPHDEDGSVPPIQVEPGIVPVSRWLMRHPSWMALCPAADELYDEIMETIRLAWCSVDSAPGKVYIGPCSTVVEQWWGDEEPRPEGPAPACFEQLFAREGDWEKRCPVCCTIHDVQERQKHLRGAVEHEYVPQRDLIGLMNDRGQRLTGSMFRNLRARKRIVPFVVVDDGDPGSSVTDPSGWKVRVWTADDVGREQLYHVGKVLNVLTTGKHERVKAA